MNLLKNCSAFDFPKLIFNFSNSTAPDLSYWHYDNRDVWSNGGSFNKMRLVIIALTINPTFIGLTDFQDNFTLLMNCTLGSLALLLKLAINFQSPDFHKSDLFPRQFTSLMNCMLGSTLYLDLNAIMTARPSSHKYRFICHFRIATLSRGIVF